MFKTQKSFHPFKQKTDAYILFISDIPKKLTGFLKEADEALSGQLSTLIKSQVISSKKFSEFVLTAPPTCPTSYFIFVGIGANASSDTLRHASAQSIRTAKRLRCETVVFDHASGQEITEGCVLGLYEFAEYKSKKADPFSFKSITILSDKASVDKGIVLGESVNLARSLANRPGNDLNPETFASYAKKYFAKSKVSVSVIDAKKAKQLKMNGLLAVGQGSSTESRLLVLSYNNAPKKKPIALVGKGVTFDTGGISIKPGKGMSEMKGDMGGAAAVFGALNALSTLQAKTNVIGLIPLAENMPSSKAQRPGDILTMMNGTTVEVINTDAEGRLILADALHYAVTLGAKQILDIATLTGACSVALGNESAAVLGNDDTLLDAIKTASATTGEKVWELPLFEEFYDYIKSPIADIMNAVETKGGGTCTAAKFLEQFVDNTPWIHVDMASVMSHGGTKGYHVKGMSGFGVRLLTEFVTQL